MDNTITEEAAEISLSSTSWNVTQAIEMIFGQQSSQVPGQAAGGGTDLDDATKRAIAESIKMQDDQEKKESLVST